MIFQMIGWIFLFVFCGAVIYVIDARIGKRFYKWLKGFGVKKGTVLDDDIGFIFNRNANHRFLFATGIAVVVMALRILEWDVNPIVEIFLFLGIMFFLPVGFHIGPIFDRLWSKKEPFFTKIDDLESGKTTFGEEFKHAYEDIKEAILPHGDETPPETESIEVKSPIVEKTPEVVKEVKEPEIDPSEAINKYLRRGGSSSGTTTSEGSE